MSRFKIFSPQGQFIAEGCPRYMSTFGQPDCIEFPSLSMPSPIEFAVGCYVDYDPEDTGLGYPNRYVMYTLPQVTKQARAGMSGDSFLYSNLQFYAPTKMLERTLFRDIVMHDNDIHFSTRATISTYEPVAGIADRIQACMNANNAGEQWHVVTEYTEDPDLKSLLEDTRNFSMNAGSSCLDALNEIYNLWKGIGWVYEKRADGHYIILGRPNIQTVGNTTGAFLYGKGKGLKLIKKSISSASDFATRLFAYGSTRNLPSRYYNGKIIHNAESVDIPNVMLPVSLWGRTDGYPDARKAYVENAEAIAKYGNIEKVVYFDGSGDNKEIYPSLEEVTIGDVRHYKSPTSKYYPKGAIYDDSERVDELLSGSSIADNGIYMNPSNGSDIFASGEYTDFNSHITFSVAGPGQMVPVRELISSLPLGTIPNTGKLLLRGKGWNYHVTRSDSSGVGLQAIIVLKLNKSTDNITLATIPVSCVDNEDRSADVYFFDSLSKVHSIQYTQGGTLTADLYLYGEIATSSSHVNFDLTAISSSEHKIEWKCKYDLAETFAIVTRQLGFDISEQATTASNGIGTVSMKTGKCAGREFAIKSCEYNAETDSWILTCNRQNDTDISQYFPNSIYQIEANDRFVLTDISMPNIYVSTAENRLLTEARRVLANMSKPKFVYEPEIDPDFQDGAKEYLTSGRYMTLVDADIIDGVTDYILIDSVTVTYGESVLPSIRITLRDEKASSFFQKTFRQQKSTEAKVSGIRSQIDNVTVGVETKSGGSESGAGGVTSVGVTSIAEGLKFTGSPITGAGTIILTIEDGYSLMTDVEKQKIADMVTVATGDDRWAKKEGNLLQKFGASYFEVGGTYNRIYFNGSKSSSSPYLFFDKDENKFHFNREVTINGDNVSRGLSLVISPEDEAYADYDSVDLAVDSYANVCVRLDDGLYSTYYFSERNDDDRVIYFTRVTRNLQMERIYIDDDGWHY